MKMSGSKIIFSFISFFSAATMFAQNKNSDILAPGSVPMLVDSGFGFAEGPAVDKEGNIFFTDQPNNKIWKYDIRGKLSVFLDKTGHSNGMYFDSKGNLISCADENNQLWSIDPKGKITILIKDYKGHTLNGPNDLWIAPNGDMYITDPYYQRDYWTREKPDSALGGEKLYYLPVHKKELILVDSGTVKPNGIVGTPDGKFLYVADFGLGKTFRYEIMSNGLLKNKQVFMNEASDGMTIDDRGNIYITGNGVTVYDRNGKQIKHIPIPEEWTANVCFGGKKRDILFITASKSVYTIQTLVKGVE
jgi:gluconolactonase